MPDNSPSAHIPKLGFTISARPLVYQVAATELEHQLGRFRDVLTLALGLIAVALGGIAVMLTDKATLWDDISALIMFAGGFIGGLALLPWDAKDAPDAVRVAKAYKVPLEDITAQATATILSALEENREPLRKKMKRAKLALIVLLIGLIVGTTSKVVESRSHDDQTGTARRTAQGLGGSGPRGRGGANPSLVKRGQPCQSCADQRHLPY